MKIEYVICALAFSLEIHAQSCSTTDCTTACLLFDQSWTTCNYDWKNKGFDSLASCLCRWHGLGTTVSALGQCTACQQDGLASNSLETYQYYAIICNTYLTEGEASAASAVASTPTTAVLGVFSSVALPAIESGLCRQSASSTTITATTSSTTVTSHSGTGTSTTTSSSIIPTPNLASEKAERMNVLLAIPVLLPVLIG